MSPIYIYLIIIAIVLVAEYFTTKLFMIWFAGGGVVAMVLSAFGLAWYVHAPAFIAVSVVLMLSLRKPVSRRLEKVKEKDVKPSKDE